MTSKKGAKVDIGLGVIVGLVTVLVLTNKVAAAPDIELSHLVITPYEVNIGQSVTISVIALNKSTQTLGRIVKLGGDFMAQHEVILAPNDSVQVSFDVTPLIARTYTVTVNNLTGSFVCTTAPVADIRLSNLTITPAFCLVGDTVTISVIAKNFGAITGSKVIICEVI